MTTPRVFACSWLPGPPADIFGPGFEVDHVDSSVTLLDRSGFLRRVEGAHGVVLNGFAMDGETIAGPAASLRVIANVGVGFDNIDVAAASARGIHVTNTPGVVTESTADMGFALLLSAARRVAEADRFVRAGKYDKTRWDTLWGQDLHGKTLGIVGMGRIGQAVARRGRGFGMDILYANRNPVDPAIADALQARLTDRENLYARADFVVFTCPLTAETRHALNAGNIGLLKPEAVVVNIARGPVIEEAALVEALRAGRIAGAGIDVYEFEPKVAAGLRALDNVTLTPHVGSATASTRSAMVQLAVDNVKAVLTGQPPLTPVNTV